MPIPSTGSHEAAILARVIRPDEDDFPPEVASAILRLRFNQADRDRMHGLAVKNQEGALTPPEEQELASYRRVGYLLDLLGAKARLALRKTARST